MAYVGTPIDTTNTFQSLTGDRFDGDASETAFTLSTAPASTLDIEVFVGNVRQDPNSAYTVSGTTLTFTGAPPSGTNNIYVVHQAKSVGTITPGANTVGVTELNLSDGSNGQFIKTDGSGTLSFASVTTPAVTALNNATENELVSVGSTTTELDAEGGLTTDGSTLTIKPGSNVHQLKLEQNNATDYWSLHADSSGGPLSFQRFTGGAETEKVRINSNGTTSIGNTGSAASSFSDTGDVGVYLSPTSSTGASTFAMSGDQPLTINRSDDNNDNSTLVGLRRRNEVCGTIKGTNNTAQYNTSSDYRLKENVNYTWDATTRLKQLKPAIFNWISDETNTAIDGFIAHEVTPVVPQATSGEKDAVDSEGRIDPQGMDHSKLVPLLTKALQEAMAKIESLEARVTTLEE